MPRCAPIYILLLTIVFGLIGLTTGIFWDNVLFISVYGNHLFSNGLLSWMDIPDMWDSGQPLLPAFWCAVIWKIGGRSLWLTHIALWPFLYLVLYYLWQIVGYFFQESRSRIAAYILAIADATFMSQLILIGPEVMLMGFFFLALYGILYQRPIHKAVGLGLLGLVSLRGMMLCGGLFLTEILWVVTARARISFKQIWPYGLGAIPACVFLIFRLCTKGWIISNPLHPWGNAWGYESMADFIHNLLWNTAVMGFRYIDMGRIVVWAILLILLLRSYKQMKCIENKQLLILAFIPVIFIILFSLVIKNTMGHRYFSVSYPFITLLTFSLLKDSPFFKRGYLVLIAALLLGNAIVYPNHIAQGWDASLAHLPYWHLRRTTIRQIEEHELLINDIATFFPNQGMLSNIDLNEDTRSFKQFHLAEKPEYVFFTNVSNLSDEELLVLSTQYEPIIHQGWGRIYCDVLKRKSLPY